MNVIDVTRLPARATALGLEAVDALARLNHVAWASTDSATLELCRLRVRALLGDRRGLEEGVAAALAAGVEPAKVAELDSWPASSAYDARERARLSFTEQFVTSVGAITAEDVDALREHASEREVYEFIAALYVVEMTERSALALHAVLGEEGR